MRRLVMLVVCGLVFLGAGPARAFAGTVEGTVKPVEWAQEVEVCLPGGVVPGEGCTVPKADGSYALSGLEGEVKLEFVPTYRSRLLTQFYDHKSTLEQATFIPVSKMEVVTGIDADLLEGGVVMGTVTEESGGAPLTEVEVCAMSVGQPVIRSCDETAAGGQYELHSLPTGFYKVGFWGRGKSAEYQPLYYPDKSSPPQATPIEVTATETTAGVNATLAKGAQVRGIVTAAASGSPLEGISVCLFTIAEATAQRCTESGAEGVYSFQGLLSGSYQVGFSLGSAEITGVGTTAVANGFQPQFYDGVAARAQAATISLLASGTAAGVDAALAPVPPPASPTPPLAVPSPIVAAAPPVAEPKVKKARCRKPKREKEVKGQVRCVKPAKHKSPKHSKHKPSR